jgi:DNA repair protein RadC
MSCARPSRRGASFVGPALGLLDPDPSTARSLGEAELLASLLAEGPRDHTALELGRRLLGRLGSLAGLGRAGPAALMEVLGPRRVSAARVVAALELGRRVAAARGCGRPSLATPREVAEHFVGRIGMLEHEQMWVVSLDGRSRLRGMRCVAQGGEHGCTVSARDILRIALADAAVGLVLVHNHPSGEPSPSSEDVSMTQAVARAAEVVGVPLLDHVIVTSSGAYASLLDLGVL